MPTFKPRSILVRIYTPLYPPYLVPFPYKDPFRRDHVRSCWLLRIAEHASRCQVNRLHRCSLPPLKCVHDPRHRPRCRRQVAETRSLDRSESRRSIQLTNEFVRLWSNRPRRLSLSRQLLPWLLLVISPTGPGKRTAPGGGACDVADVRYGSQGILERAAALRKQRLLCTLPSRRFSK